MARITKEELMAQLNAFNEANPSEALSLRGAGKKNMVETLCDNHVNQASNRAILKKYNDEVVAYKNIEGDNLRKIKRENLIASAKNGNEYHRDILAKSGINWEA